jgi:peroxin-6
MTRFFLNSNFFVKSLSDDQRREFLCGELILREDTVTDLVKKTSGLYYGEMKTLCDLISQNSSQSIDATIQKFQSNRKFQQENKLKVDSIRWSDVGGLTDIKEIITDTIILPLKYPALFTSSNTQLGITRSGILLYGPPGTGKTLLAKAISNECGLNFLSVKGPELLDMYVGQTEQNVRNLFEKARLNSPCILFFDELDSLAPVRGRSGDSGGVMDRVVSQLLTEIDGLDKLNSNGKISQIFLIGATNRPDLIDQSLLRPGRFDKLVYVPIAKEFDERYKIFEALVRKLPLDANFDKESFVREKCPANLSGADFYAITNKARQIAIKRIISGQQEFQDDKISEEDFNRALQGFRANLSDQELLVYENYFNRFSNKK